jgi:hypothetical protein
VFTFKEERVGAVEMVRSWRRTVKGIFGGGGGGVRLHGHLVNALALLSFAVAAAGHCHGGRVAAAAPSPAATVASRRRRLERLLANPRLDVRAAMAALARFVLSAWAASGRPVLLVLDETPGGPDGRLCCMRVSVAYHKRTVPVAYACYRAGRQGRPMPSVVRGLLARAAEAVAAAGCTGAVTLLADRGLCWPAVIDFCRGRGWHYVLRMQAPTRVRLPDGTERAARDLCPRPGTSWFGRGVLAFKNAGWLRANVVGVWERRCRQPWLLVSDLPASYARCRAYAKRSWCEQSHRDDKSAGFHWGDSRVGDPRHAARLLLVIALATLLALGLGTRVLKRGLRRAFDGGRVRRTLSLFQLGLRWLRDCITNQRDDDLAVALYPP